ncbi:hypothetical protein CLV30_106138 [Haloactinopolyspora alba]|uniref:Uncharacterized protein n=1 Tax=Haloactinopolyspora alba TaxID=648780 RepID=A0A2P8E3T7_9ACTN|nr:hypothetical protein [Haloactinopolyspora alba]PSL04133.1 hypothetical protein CLV30_106138 [Haloactinopolyspora alba]
MPLPDAVDELVEFAPLEDVLLPILRDGLPGVAVYSLIPEEGLRAFVEGEVLPFVLVRRHAQQGYWDGDIRFLDQGDFTIHTFTADPDGDEDGARLSDAVRVVLRNAWMNKVTVPGRGSVTRLRMLESPRRVTDWATSSGPVQYADLPTGVWRYETLYGITIRRAL